MKVNIPSGESRIEFFMTYGWMMVLAVVILWVIATFFDLGLEFFLIVALIGWILFATWWIKTGKASRWIKQKSILYFLNAAFTYYLIVWFHGYLHDPFGSVSLSVLILFFAIYGLCGIYLLKSSKA